MTSLLRVIERPTEARTADIDDVRRRLSDSSCTSLELSRVGAAWPMLAILVNGRWCVIHLTTSQNGRLLILRSEEGGGAPEELEFSYAGMPAVFTREYLNSTDATLHVVRGFAEEKPSFNSYSWEEL